MRVALPRGNWRSVPSFPLARKCPRAFAGHVRFVPGEQEKPRGIRGSDPAGIIKGNLGSHRVVVIRLRSVRFQMSIEDQRSGRLPSRIPSLDGLRAVAISLVIAEHAAQRGSAWIPDRARGYMSLLAISGVKIFFVLSGFLITSILLREFSKTGTISLKNFYWRRTLRIFPAMYVFLAVVAVGYWVGIVGIGNDSPFRILYPALYISDYLQVWGWPLHHTWSLSVEEQFYFLWPAFLLLSGIRRAGLFPGFLILVALVSRVFAFDYYRFDSEADSIAIGCLAAIYRPQLQQFLSRWWPGRLSISLALPVLALPLANTYSRHVLFSALVGVPLFNVAVGISMLGVILEPPAWLNSVPVVWLGRISYSLYLWHLPWVVNKQIGWLWLPAAVLCAWLSYRLLEVPILQWRDRRTDVISPGAMPAVARP
jgi:peptidoglycan/LPS O-acetylase OafA/YrhL